jgi:large subunit ribosomal protein L28e
MERVRNWELMRNLQALGIVPNEKGGVRVISKKPASVNKPASSLYTVTYGANKTARKSVQSRPRLDTGESC